MVKVRASGTVVRFASKQSQTSFSIPPSQDFLLLPKPKDPIYVVPEGYVVEDENAANGDQGNNNNHGNEDDVGGGKIGEVASE